jgi:hypothetical protein
VEPGGALLELLGERSPGRQSRLEALIHLGAARLIALGSQVQTAPRHPVESLIRRNASQAKGRAAFEGAERAGVATELRDDGIDFGPGGGWSDSGLGCWGGRGQGLCAWTRQETCHRQDARLTSFSPGLPAAQVAHGLTHGLA